MPRKLPWLSQSAKATTERSDSRSSPRPPNQSKIRGLDSDDELPVTPRAERKKKEQADPLSSSPVRLSPEREPPKMEYMHEGVDADDGWMMVEDEFLETARLFTRRFHLTRYKDEIAPALTVRKQTSHGIDPKVKPPKETQIRMGVDALSKAQKKAFQAGPESSDEEEAQFDLDLPISGASSRLSSVPAPRRSREVSKGPTKQPLRKASTPATARALPDPARRSPPRSTKKHTIERPIEHEYNSLDIPPRARPITIISASETSSVEPSPSTTIDKRSSSPSKPATISKLKSRLSSQPRTSRFAAFDDFDGFKPSPQPSEHSEFAGRVAKRKAEKEKKEQEQKKKSIRLDEIPTFLL